MPSVRQLRLAAGAGETDDVLARRIDVVTAALAWQKTYLKASDGTRQEFAHAQNEGLLYQAVCLYQGAVKARRESRK